jgi:pimeloyl-ACP methyl ester carboxylesterase
MTTEEWKSAGKIREAGGYQLFLREGPPNGPPLLLLHGFPTASWDWHKLWPELSQRFQLIAPDFLGFGFSEKPYPHAYSVTEQADLCRQLLTLIGASRYHILAHDYGNSVAQELMALAREQDKAPRILSVAFLNGGLFPEAHQPRLIQSLLASPAGFLLVPFMSKSTLRRTFNRIFGPDYHLSESEIDSFWQLLQYHRGKRCIPALLRYMEERVEQRHRWVPPLLDSPYPIRLINGPEDPISGRHLAEHYANLRPDADIVYIKGVGHYPQIEAPEAVLDAFLDFHT